MSSQKQAQEDIKHTTCINTSGRSLKSVYDVNSVQFDPRTGLYVQLYSWFLSTMFPVIVSSKLKTNHGIMVGFWPIDHTKPHPSQF